MNNVCSKASDKLALPKAAK